MSAYTGARAVDSIYEEGKAPVHNRVLRLWWLQLLAALKKAEAENAFLKARLEAREKEERIKAENEARKKEAEEKHKQAKPNNNPHETWRARP